MKPDKKVEQFAKQINYWHKRVETLQQDTGELSLPQQQLEAETKEELSTALEELHVAEEELRQQNEELLIARMVLEAEHQRYQELFEFAPDGYLVTDIQGTIQEANRAATTLLNVSQQFLVGKPLVVFVAETERHAFYTYLTQLHSLDGVSEREIRLQPFKNVSFDAALTVGIVRNQDGLPVALRWLLRNITDRKLTESALRESEERYRLLINNVLDYAILTLDPDGYIVSWNIGAEHILGYSSAEIIGQHASCFFTPEDVEGGEDKKEQRTAVAEGRASEEHWYIRSDGTRFWASSILTALRDAAGNLRGFSKIMRDLTSRKRMEEALQQSEQAATQQLEELRKLSQLKDDFVSTVSHELRTPLANMKMAIRLLKTVPASIARERYLQVLENECVREIELVNNLLDLQRLEAASYSISRDVVSLQDWLPKIIESFLLRTQERQQQLSIVLPPSVQSLFTDRAGLERVLVELLNNACKYTSSGGEIVLKVRQDSDSSAGSGNPKAAEQGDKTRVTTFTISNQAEIPDSELPHIFDKLYRVPKADPWKQGGTGLGLALVQKLVAQMSGTIQVESSSGWSTFTVQLPNLLD